MSTRWIVASVCALLSLFCIIGNPLAGMSAVKQGRNYSSVPFIGGLAGVISILALPIGTWHTRLWFAWIPLVLDYTYPLFAYSLIWDCVLKRPMTSRPDPND